MPSSPLLTFSWSDTEDTELSETEVGRNHFNVILL